jgi:peptidylprolyl isomerase
MTIADGDEVTIEYIGRLPDGSIFDTSDPTLAEESGLDGENPERDFSPLTVHVGEGNVIEGLQDALRDLEEGDSTTVEIPPEKAYGEHREGRVAEYDRDAFEEMIGDRELELGFEVEVKETGLPGRVIEFDEGSVTVDFNHERAGDTLEFEIDIVDVE